MCLIMNQMWEFIFGEFTSICLIMIRKWEFVMGERTILSLFIRYTSNKHPLQDKVRRINKKSIFTCFIYLRYLSRSNLYSNSLMSEMA
jgi:hypothetical protein